MSRYGKSQSGCAAVSVGRRSAIGWDIDEEDEDGFVREVGGVIARDDFQVFSGFAEVYCVS